MCELRLDITTGEWVIVAEDRDELGSGESPCPYCAGREIGDSSQVRVLPHPAAVLSPSPGVDPVRTAGLFSHMQAVGFHEIVIETPDHGRDLAEFDDAEIESVLHAYQLRYQALRADPRVRMITIFHQSCVPGRGDASHSHSQIVAIPVVSAAEEARQLVALRYYEVTGRAIYGDLLAAELNTRERLISRSVHFAAVAPFASHVAFETWIVPKTPAASFGDLTAAEVTDLAHMLRDTLHRLRAALGDRGYTAIIHSAPVRSRAEPNDVWHWEILPDLAGIGRSECASTLSVTRVSPEKAASMLRAVEPGQG